MKFRAVAAGAVLCLCSSPLLAQGLGRVQLLALQQQLRDDGCGVSHVTGRMDAMTRSAVRKCAAKYNVSNPTAASLLAAMNIGFGPTDPKPTMAGAKGGGTSGMAGTTDIVKPTESSSSMGGSAGTRLDSARTMPTDTMKRDTTMRDSSMMSPTTPVPSTPATPPAMPMNPPATPTTPPTPTMPPTPTTTNNPTMPTSPPLPTSQPPNPTNPTAPGNPTIPAQPPMPTTPPATPPANPIPPTTPQA